MTNYYEECMELLIDYGQHLPINIRSIYSYLSKHHHITWDIIEMYPDMPWDYTNVSANPNITWDIIEEYPDIPWDIIQNNPDKEWKMWNRVWIKIGILQI